MLQFFSESKRIVTPFTMTIVFGWMVYGIIIIVSSFIPSWSPDPALTIEPWIVETITGLFIALGSFLIMLAEYPWQKITTSWTIDKLGMLLGFGGWLSYTICVLVIDRTRLGAACLGLIACTAFLVRFIFAYMSEKFIKRRVKRWSGLASRH